ILKERKYVIINFLIIIQANNNMDTVGIKVISQNEINRCIKILRKYCKLSIGEIKEAIISNNYVVECSYVKEEGIVNIIKLYKELCDNNIQAQLYEHERITNVEFLENLVETYYEINEEIADRIDTESE
ncbi:hypothetical protein, partial [Roseburia intestinalis]